ncbi:sulfatase [Halococcoides cellulosivorans]|uniref:sulfatase n=1 Tax=Halococcoides cellulosivorans TaxID=1679096 RepID=UPI00131F0A2B|nr:sulfatase [Halococcoides cellulosivorans]
MSDARPNVVCVSIDSLRADHCGFLGDDRGLTPAMDALAAESTVYERAIAPGPQTFSSMPAVVTGHRRPTGPLDAYPGEEHWERRMAAIESHLDRYPTLAERFAARGYATAGVSPNPWASTASGFDRGFETFVDLVGERSDDWLHRAARRAPGIDASSKPVQLALDGLTGGSFFSSWGDYVDEIDRLRRDLPEPYFLWVFLMDTHYPFLPSKAHREEQTLVGSLTSAIRSEAAMRGPSEGLTPAARASVQRSYRDTVRSVDAFVDHLRDGDAQIVLHADHGESFGEHGNYGHHHRACYTENVHVPLVVAGPAERVAEPISLDRIPAMALSVADDSADPRAHTAPAVTATSECGTNACVRGRRFAYVEREEGRSLFEWAHDPNERDDLAPTHPDLCDRARRRLDYREGSRRETAALASAAQAIAPEW